MEVVEEMVDFFLKKHKVNMTKAGYVEVCVQWFTDMICSKGEGEAADLLDQFLLAVRK